MKDEHYTYNIVGLSLGEIADMINYYKNKDMDTMIINRIEKQKVMDAIDKLINKHEGAKEIAQIKNDEDVFSHCGATLELLESIKKEFIRNKDGNDM